MPFMRYANAQVVKTTQLADGGWDRIRVASGQVKVDRDLVDQASKILKDEFNPKKYLLTHATIVASVDTVSVPGVKLGSATVEGKQVVRKTTAFRIKPECDAYINNNLDSWSRPVLLKSYKTFVGGHSFLEHVQIEELSKGRILDAVARDIGDSVYIDILVANDRKHSELIRDIESGEITTLSMGCSIDGSTCTKCGHWAADETEMCEHVRFMKGNAFYDEKGQKHRIAELCGDVSIDPTGGVTFIEASWVKVPAFKGAVSRGIISLEEDEAQKKTAQVLKAVFSSPAPKVDPEHLQKAASIEEKKGEEEFNPFEGGDSEGESPPAEETKPEKGPFEEVEEELTTALIEKVRKRVKDQLSKSNLEEKVTPPSDSPNDTIVRQAREKFLRDLKATQEKHREQVQNLLVASKAQTKVAKGQVYQAALRTILATSKKEVEILERIAVLNSQLGIFVPQDVYRVGLKVGATSKYATLEDFVVACKVAMKRQPTISETKTLLRLGSLLSAHQRSRRDAEGL
jgi:hypothetical protein